MPENIRLQAVVSSPGWRWLPGMLDTDGRRVISTSRFQSRDGGVSLRSLWHSTTGWHYGRDGLSFGSGPTKGEALSDALVRVDLAGKGMFG